MQAIQVAFYDPLSEAQVSSWMEILQQWLDLVKQDSLATEQRVRLLIAGLVRC